VKVLFDSQVFDWQLSGGISRYFSEVINQLDADPDIDVLFKCRHSYNRYIQDSKWLNMKPLAPHFYFKGKLRLVKMINQQLNRPFSNHLLKTSIPDIFHPTYYNPYFLRYLGKTPLVLTVHDLTTEKLQSGDPSVKRILDWKACLIHKADHIITVSENTKKDTMEYYKISPEKITTAYLASNLVQKYDSGIPNSLTLPQEFILYIGSRQGYKNFNYFLTEVSSVLKKYKLSLVIAGGGEMNANENALLKQLNIQDHCLALPQVNDQQLVELYKQAVLFIFPSLYEGFGIPVIEAMECKCPVLLSNNSSLPEVGGDAAAYFDPTENGSLASELCALLDNREKLSLMSDLGVQQAGNFSWESTTAVHTEVYRNLI
jgi:glycosyltransferase involved in cell wall biosynthesis